MRASDELTRNVSRTALFLIASCVASSERASSLEHLRLPTAFSVGEPGFLLRRFLQRASRSTHQRPIYGLPVRNSNIAVLKSKSDDSLPSKIEALSLLQRLEVQLDSAVQNEDYAEAQRIKNQIAEMRRDATIEFYRAFREGDLPAMENIWVSSSRGVDIATCAHPGRETIVGRDAVVKSWRDIMSAGSPNIRPENVKVFLPGGGGVSSAGGGCAWVVCEEHIEGHPACLATNIFVADPAAQGGWRIAHHQGGHLVYYGLRVTQN